MRSSLMLSIANLGVGVRIRALVSGLERWHRAQGQYPVTIVETNPTSAGVEQSEKGIAQGLRLCAANCTKFGV
jgi:hypothetical protein